MTAVGVLCCFDQMYSLKLAKQARSESDVPSFFPSPATFFCQIFGYQESRQLIEMGLTNAMCKFALHKERLMRFTLLST